MRELSRRQLGKLSAGLAVVGAASLVGGGQVAGQNSGLSRPPKLPRMLAKAEIPQSRYPRVVIVGGGWSGLTIARQLKRLGVPLDVLLVEKREVFFSHLQANLWLGGLVELDHLTHSFLDAAKLAGYVYFNAALVDIDRTSRRAYTDQGYIDYDYLVLAPGIDYDYGSFGVKDAGAEQFLRAHYPAGFKSGSEHLSLKRKLDEFKGGIFVLTAPPGIYRCAASPYERASIIAARFKRDGIKGKVVLIDPRDQPAVNGDGFLAAFENLYRDHLEYMPSVVIKGVDPIKKTVSTDFDDIQFTDAAIYPRVRAAKMIEAFGLADKASQQKEGAIDPFNYNVIGDERVYITGDCRPMPFSKSASVAVSEGAHVARVIAANAEGKAAKWATPESRCYSVVGLKPEQALLSLSYYRFDKATKQWEFAPNSSSDNTRSEKLARDNHKWGAGAFKELFG
ncbi:MAG: FAD-dependent oxidoreductase [Rhodospirillales bacterium]|nr:FAD-dependent oxidoreductase [Rhodospirillales bacterium]